MTQRMDIDPQRNSKMGSYLMRTEGGLLPWPRLVGFPFVVSHRQFLTLKRLLKFQDN